MVFCASCIGVEKFISFLCKMHSVFYSENRVTKKRKKRVVAVKGKLHLPLKFVNSLAVQKVTKISDCHGERRGFLSELP